MLVMKMNESSSNLKLGGVICDFARGFCCFQARWMSQMLADEITRQHNLLQIHNIGLDPKTIEHVNKIFSSNIPRSSFSIRATPRPETDESTTLIPI